jgi:CheY-like chemotaxis protein
MPVPNSDKELGPMTPATSSTNRIILMEDNPSDVFLLRRALDQHGVAYTVEVVHDGEAGLELLGRVARGELAAPDLIVLDLNLPRHDGIEVLERCREMKALRNVAVMILTSSDSPEERERAEQLGVADFVRKPIMLDDFMALGARVRTLLEQH